MAVGLDPSRFLAGGYVNHDKNTTQTGCTASHLCCGTAKSLDDCAVEPRNC
jgi:hypothetical protein